jgi:hypothetical protein
VKGTGGDWSAFWDGPIYEAPWSIVVALNHALTVISWHENLPKDEQPPRHIWWSGDLVAEWFADVEEQRNSRYGGKRKRSSYDEAEDVPMMDNDLAASVRAQYGK